MQTGERRKNVRIKDRLQLSYRLQVSYRLIDPEESKDAGSPEKYFPYIWSKYPSSVILEETEDANFKILPHIIDLNRKIDILIELLTNENRHQIEVPMTRDVCISASGIKINIIEPSTPGQKIALCIILPFVPPVQLFITGEVTRSILLKPVSNETYMSQRDTKGDENNPPSPPLSKGGMGGFSGESAIYETGIKFLDLKEEDYEKIIKYIFKKQRDLLKDKKRLTDNEASG